MFSVCLSVHNGGEGFLLWLKGVPTLAGGSAYPSWGYLPWGYLPWSKVGTPSKVGTSIQGRYPPHPTSENITFPHATYVVGKNLSGRIFAQQVLCSRLPCAYLIKIVRFSFLFCI